MMEKKEETKKDPQSATPDYANGDEQRYMVPTKQGVIDQDVVNSYREAHQEAMLQNMN